MSNPNSETKINAHNMSDAVSPPHLDMRQMDQFLLSQIQAESVSNRKNSHRLTQVETDLRQVKINLEKMEQHHSSLVQCQETIALDMSAITSNLAHHTAAEEQQWGAVNANHKHIDELARTVQQHFYDVAALGPRIDWVERLLWAAWGVIGAAAATLIPLALRGLGVL